MTRKTQLLIRRVSRRAAFGTLVLAGLIYAGATSWAGELIPSVGVTKGVEGGGNDTDAKLYGGVAFRGNIAPILKSEIGISYRNETRLNGDLNVRMVPVTAWLWLTPIPALYAGGGVGWYHTRFDYNPALPFTDTTEQKFGVHLGGGLEVPLSPAAALDLNGRYVFMDKQNSQLPPAQFNPDFWSTTLGLAIHF
jgi:opacity protein-like surface antigen